LNEENRKVSEKSIAIIGAGIAGLAAGCYGRMNGYDTHIFELHTKPGGLCTSWSRSGYTFDGCLHWLVGSREGYFYELWREVGALPGPQIVDFDWFFAYEAGGGGKVTFYNDPDRLQEHLLEIAPEDAREIKKFTAAVRRAASFDMAADKPPELFTFGDRIKMFGAMLPYMGLFMKWGRLSLRDFGARLKNPLLAEAMTYGLLPEAAVFHFVATLAWMWRRNAGYPVGGSLPFSKSIERKYLDLGGEIHYRARVEKILIEGDRAVGVRLEDGSEHRADFVLSAADGRATIFDMLEGRYVDDKTRRHYAGELPIFEPLLYLSFGVDGAFEEAPHYLTFNFASPLRVAGEEVRRATYRVYNFDPTLAPPGKVTIIVSFESRYDYWKKLYEEDRERYREEKDRLAAAVLDELERRLPGIKNKVEVVDVATPVTFERYTGNWQGSFEGWRISPRTLTLRMDKTLPGLANFWLAGQWVQPGGGVPTALVSGRQAIQLICHQEGRAFRGAAPAAA
jgi:phytoene dehydrogenase-like protein